MDIGGGGRSGILVLIADIQAMASAARFRAAWVRRRSPDAASRSTVLPTQRIGGMNVLQSGAQNLGKALRVMLIVALPRVGVILGSFPGLRGHGRRP